MISISSKVDKFDLTTHRDNAVSYLKLGVAVCTSTFCYARNIDGLHNKERIWLIKISISYKTIKLNGKFPGD